MLGDVLPEPFVTRDVRAYRDRVELLFDRLLFGALTPDLELGAARRGGRALWDLLHRVAHLGEGIEAELEPFFDDARAAIERACGGDAIDVAGWRARVAAALGDEEAALALADGTYGRALAQLEDGLASVVPCTAALLPDGALEALAASDALWDRAPLAVRLGRWLDAADLRDLSAFEHALASAARDDQVERLCAPADELDDGLVIRDEGFAIHAFDHAVVEVHAAFAAGEPFERPARAPGRWLVGGFGDAVAVLPCPDAVARAWAALEGRACEASEIERILDEALDDDAPEGWPTDGASWLSELLESGALGRLL